MDSKLKWREETLQKRRQLQEEFIRDASYKIATHLFALEEFRLAERIALYAPVRGEVDTSRIFKQAHDFRKEIYYPSVHTEEEAIRFYRVQRLEDLAQGYAGILEPPKVRHPLSNINYLNIIIVPGVCFDSRGNRLGYGKGYYDRLLKGYNGKRVALAYDFQVCDVLPSQEKDERVDIVVTEERVLRII